MKKTNDLLNGFQNLANALRDFFDGASAPVADPDITNRSEVYAHVATFLSERLGGAVAEVRDAVHRLCGEEEKDILAEGKMCDAALVEHIKQLLLVVLVQYQLTGTQQAKRVVVIRFLADGRPAERSVTEVIPWEGLPGDVRSERLRHAVSKMEFQLYPRDDETSPQAH